MSEFKKAPLKRFANFIIERDLIRQRRADGQPKPWTNDPILRKYKFTNIHREADRTTEWIAAKWRRPNDRDPDLWFAMAVARLVNLPATLEELGYPVPFDPKRFVRVLGKRKERGEPVFSGAYIINQAVTGGYGMLKHEYLAKVVLPPLWKNRAQIRPLRDDLLAGFHFRLTQYYGFGGFLAAQVVADMKYVQPLKQAHDWDSFAASGPGSRRGMNRLLELPETEALPEAEWHRKLLLLQTIVRDATPHFLHAQDLQNCLCEFSKYERARTGEGRPKTLYPGE